MNRKIALALGGLTLAVGLTGLTFFWPKSGLAQQNQPPPPAKPAPKQTPAAQFRITDICRWEVHYSDSILGEVKGTAYVNWEKKRARVVLQHPITAQQFQLYSSNVELEEQRNGSETVTMTLDGKSPSSDKVSPPSILNPVKLTVQEGAQVEIKPAKGNPKITVQQKAEPQLNRLKLEMKVGPGGVMTGSWSYLADPLTERDREGFGRVGYFRLLNKDELEESDFFGAFIGKQSGFEAWWPLPTEIVAATAVEDQLAFENSAPLFPYPRLSSPAMGTQQTYKYQWIESKHQFRTVYIIGRNFPTEKGKALTEVKASWLMKASLITTSEDPELSQANKEKLRIGREKVLQGLDEKTRNTVSQMEEALISIELPDGVYPEQPFLAGVTGFSWGTTAAAWMLQFGNNEAEARFVRYIRQATPSDPTSADEVEQIGAVYLPERIAVEIETRVLLPTDKIPVLVTIRGKEDRVLALTAQRIKDPAHITYRTAPFSVLPEPATSPAETAAGTGTTKSGPALNAKVGDEMIALVTQKEVPFKFAPAVSSRVLRTPDIKGQLTLWKEAVQRAAACKKLVGAPQELAGKPADTVSYKLRSINISVGNQAAMLLLRSTFLEMMQAQVRWLDFLKTEQELAGFREWVRPFIFRYPPAFQAQPKVPVGWEKYPKTLEYIDFTNQVLGQLFELIKGKVKEAISGEERLGENSAFAQLLVTGPDGKPTVFYSVFLKDYRKDLFGGEDGEKKRQEWQLRATQEALAEYRKAVETSLAEAKNIGDCDCRALLKLTGPGFGMVINRLMPRLMGLDDSAGPQSISWVPDNVARAEVANLYQLHTAVLALEDYSSIQSQYVLLAVAAVLSVPAIISESALVAVGTLAANVLFFDYEVGSALYEKYKTAREIEFEFGSSIVLGPERLAAAELKKTEWWQTTLSLGVQAAFILVQARFDTLPKLERHSAIIRGKQLLPKIQEGGIDAFRALPPEQQADFLTYLVDAKLRKDRSRVASLNDIRALYKSRQLVNEAKPAASRPGQSPSTKLEEPVDFPTAEPKGWSEATAATGRGDLQPAPNRKIVVEPPDIAILRELPAAGNPAPKNFWFAGESEGKAVFYKLGRRLGGGASSDVYEIVDAIGTTLPKEGAVIKFVRSGEGFGTALEQILRMSEANNLLKAAHKGNFPIEFAEILEIHPEARTPYLIQERVNIDRENIVKISVGSFSIATPMEGFRYLLPYEEVSKIFKPDMQRAIPKLFADLAQNKFVSTDMSLPNIYFKRVGNDWVAGILDVDHIVSVQRITKSKTWEWIAGIRRDPYNKGLTSVNVDGRKLNNSFDFMEKMLEYKYGGNSANPFVSFDEATGEFTPALIHPDMIKKYFPKFGEGLRPPKKTSLLRPRLLNKPQPCREELAYAA